MRKDLYCRSDNPGKPCTVHVAVTNSKSIIKVNSLVILRWTENLRKENTCEEIVSDAKTWRNIDRRVAQQKIVDQKGRMISDTIMIQNRETGAVKRMFL